MKFINYKKALVALIATTALVLGLYLETKAPERFDVNKIDFNNAAVIGASRGELICSEKAEIKLVYQNYSNQISLKRICEVLDVRKENL